MTTNPIGTISGAILICSAIVKSIPVNEDKKSCIKYANKIANEIIKNQEVNYERK